ncbi:DUF2914 domain-containing protein [Desulfobacula sp.]|uniref:DUF2914 domain-containing protein n=1 Tax=Desulfobacula sp. TaxID=2593537 RepID=UPI00261478D5|nr:DUF2914 domain-containing protein [Desulfobacula sp.]
MIEKLIAFAESGKGRRLLNTLNKRETVLTSSELDDVLRAYCDIGLPREVEMLKKRRGILDNDQYNALAEAVRRNCCSERYDDFIISLKILLSSGMKMNPAKMNIEENDQHLTKKIRKIIDNKKKPVWITGYFWVPVLLFTGLIMAGLMIFRDPSTTRVSSTSAPASKASLETASPLAAKGVLQSEKKTVSLKATPKPPEAILNTDRPAPAITTAQSKPTEQIHIPSDIHISEIVTCSSVRARQYVSARTTFSLKKGLTPMVWMTVLSDSPPFTLYHVYYVNGRRHCRIPLKIRHPRMRTWSNITLSSRDHVGKWRVEVMTENGVKLDQIEFSVTE